jgi:hypothetical protein
MQLPYKPSSFAQKVTESWSLQALSNLGRQPTLVLHTRPTANLFNPPRVLHSIRYNRL